MPRSVCGGCQKIFSSTTAFENHRTGTFEEALYAPGDIKKKRPIGYTKPARRCMTTDEMLTNGAFAVEQKPITRYRDGRPYQVLGEIWFEPQAREKMRDAFARNDDDKETADEIGREREEKTMGRYHQPSTL